jgi:XTP/dITP diphosphohydrolase
MRQPLVIASNNPEKRRMIGQVAREFGLHTRLYEEICGKSIDIAETGESYLENALLKACVIFELTRQPSIADDFGMELIHLNGKPGVATRTWENPSRSDARLLDNAIALARGLSPEERSCDFVGTGVIVYAPGRFLRAMHTDHGILLDEPRGALIPGHPLASLLLIPQLGKTLAELRTDGYHAKDYRIYAQLLQGYLALPDA